MIVKMKMKILSVLLVGCAVTQAIPGKKIVIDEPIEFKEGVTQFSRGFIKLFIEGLISKIGSSSSTNTGVVWERIERILQTEEYKEKIAKLTNALETAASIKDISEEHKHQLDETGNKISEEFLSFLQDAITKSNQNIKDEVNIDDFKKAIDKYEKLVNEILKSK